MSSSLADTKETTDVKESSAPDYHVECRGFFLGACCMTCAKDLLHVNAWKRNGYLLCNKCGMREAADLIEDIFDEKNSEEILEEQDWTWGRVKACEC